MSLKFEEYIRPLSRSDFAKKEQNLENLEKSETIGDTCTLKIRYGLIMFIIYDCGS